MAKTEVMLHDEWKAVRIDSMSWQVYQLREIKASGNPDSRKRAGEVDWVALPAYFGNVAAAAGYVHDHLGDKAGKKSLAEFVEFMRKERKKVVDTVRKEVG